MALLIVIGVTLAVLGSVMWVMPSKRDQAIIAMRQCAMSHGIRVRLMDQAMAAKWIPWVEDFRGLVIYEKSRQPHEAAKNSPQSEADNTAQQGSTGIIRLNEKEMPQSVFKDESKEAKLTRLLSSDQIRHIPPGAEALYVGAEFVALIWDERGGDDAVNKIADILKSLS